MANLREKAVVYVRVSSRGQEDNTSLESQEKTCLAYADRLKFDVVKTWRGPESAWKDDSKADDERLRKNFQEMLSYIHTHREIKHLIFDVTDRMSRNADDSQTIRKLVKKGIVSIHFARSNRMLHKGSVSDDFFMLGIESLMAEKYSADHSQRVRKGMEATLEMGMWMAIAPLGYLNNSTTKILSVDPKRAPLVQRAFELKANGAHSVEKIADILYDEGFRSRKLGKKYPGEERVALSKIYKMLRDPFYYGEFLWNGKMHQGIYKPLVSKELWLQAQDNFKSHLSNPKKHTFAYNSLLYCKHCKCKVIGGMYKKKRYELYHCTFGRGKHKEAPYLSPAKIKELFRPFIENITLPDGAFDAIKLALEDYNKHNNKYRLEAIAKLETEKRLYTERTSKLYDEKLDGHINDDFWQMKNSEYRSALFALDEQLTRLNTELPYYVNEGIKIFELMKSLITLYDSADDMKRGALLKSVVLNCALNGENVEPVMKKPFCFVAEGLVIPYWWRRRELNPRPDLFRQRLLHAYSGIWFRVPGLTGHNNGTLLSLSLSS